MSTNESKAREHFDSVHEEFLEKITSALSEYGDSCLSYLADFVSSLCNVNRKDLLSSCKRVHESQSRWLYWYALRYFTSESYVMIAERCASDKYGAKFTPRAVGFGVSQMSRMICTMPYWKSRWIAVKKIIEIKDRSFFSQVSGEAADKKVTIVVPEGVEVEIQKEKTIK